MLPIFPRGARDERGAILIFGLLASTLLVGVLWWLMGMGEALAFHERGQEVADAAAFSTAVVEARALNTIVLLNLVMSAILAVRVLVRLVQFALIIAGIALIATIVGIPFGVTALELSADVEEIYKEINPTITAGLDALSLVAAGVGMSMSGMGKGAGTFVEKTYAPVAKSVIVESPYAEESDKSVQGFPVSNDADGTTACKKATEALGGLISGALTTVVGGHWDESIGRALGAAISPLTSGSAPQALLFCGLGVSLNITPPSIPGADDALANLSKNCRKNVADSGVAVESSEGRLKIEQCEANVKNQYGKATGAIGTVASTAGSTVVNDALDAQFPPTMRLEGWKNGNPETQILSVVTLDTSRLSLGTPKLVSMAAFGKEAAAEVPAADSAVAVAQAETYYDCVGQWSGSDCRGDTEALWNFRWQARLVPVNTDGPALKSAIFPVVKEYKRLEATPGGAGGGADFRAWLGDTYPVVH